jgi:hypothetical protein
VEGLWDGEKPLWFFPLGRERMKEASFCDVSTRRKKVQKEKNE